MIQDMASDYNTNQKDEMGKESRQMRGKGGESGLWGVW